MLEAPGALAKRVEPPKENAREQMMPHSARPIRLDQKLIALLALLLLACVCMPAHAQQIPNYKLHAGDQLDVSVWKEVDLTKQIIVRPDGRFSFPLVGEINAAGRGVAELQAEIETKLKKFIPEPVVSITLMQVGGNKVYVIGQVKTPGAFIMNPQLSVLQALSLAGGMTPFASVNGIQIIRSAGPKQTVLPFRYEEVSKGRALEQNILLESGDVVVVP